MLLMFCEFSKMIRHTVHVDLIIRKKRGHCVVGWMCVNDNGTIFGSQDSMNLN